MTDVLTTLAGRAPGVDEPLAGVYGPDGRPTFFVEPAMDRFASVVLNLAAELWVQEERLRALEGRTPGTEEERDQAAKAFVARVFEPLREPKSE